MKIVCPYCQAESVTVKGSALFCRNCRKESSLPSGREKYSEQLLFKTGKHQRRIASNESVATSRKCPFCNGVRVTSKGWRNTKRRFVCYCGKSWTENTSGIEGMRIQKIKKCKNKDFLPEETVDKIKKYLQN
ncbi:hypothetical protein L6279_03945, partial [Candidatus Parcubacteria bacterium]|nr:hypothetical protein [Candidatus Parcubacteria bacterium]